MASNFDEIVSRNHEDLPNPDFASLSIDPVSMPTEPDAIKRDRFELLSAYLDGEVTPAENRLVATWLSEDPETQCLYRRLLMLRQAMRHIPIETVIHPSPQIKSRGSSLLTQNNQRFKKVSLAIACTAATLLVGTLTNIIGSESSNFQFTWLPSPWGTVNDDLELALDEPVINLEDTGAVIDLNE